ncbi:DUF1566 domain-containing protein [Massilia sp. TN1-12]|uniref:DUF1566 domain-containing protein n=1 Tax=Massilia paldalensis TaxID=3377675 RepID=UPI003850462A
MKTEKDQWLAENMKDGELYAGIVLGTEGSPDYHLVLLPNQATDVNWSAARQWAFMREAALPTRRELALLFANRRDHFDRIWYWADEEHDTRPQLVWGQNFASGIQTVYGKPFRGAACAVRRIEI